MTQLKIGIAGAGIGGLAVAAGLARDGHDVALYDQFDTPRPVGSGLVIQPVGQAVLSQIGANDAAHGLGRKITHMLGHEARRNRAILDVQYDPDNTGHRYGLAIHRASLFHVLMTAADTAGVKIRTSARVTGHETGHLIFETGERSDRFDLIIDATGATSPMSPLKARTLPYGAVWGTVDWPKDAPVPDWQLSQRYRHARNMVGVLPIGQLPGDTKDKAAIFWSLPKGGFDGFQRQPIAEWKAEAEALWPDFAPFLADVTDHAQLTPAFYSHGTLRNPTGPGFVHIGDAAHRASPQLGQGANMALLDAWALCVACREGKDLDDALQRYRRMRARHLWLYQAMSALFTPLYQSDSRILPVLRDHLLAPLSKLRPTRYLLARLVCGDLVAPLRKTGLRLPNT